MTYSDSKDNIYSLEWNYDGSQIAITGKDKMLRLFDPRIPDEASSIESFDGTKSSKLFWLNNLGWIGATGFSKSAQRQLKLWDLRNLSSPILSIVIDQASSVLMPYYDTESGMLYMNGKGDGSVLYLKSLMIQRNTIRWEHISQVSPKKAVDGSTKRA
eukprot:TRINITY_DN4473_c0_g1_i1.p1 TRINITY_DN4473_c0_g1~~TRINITY_DN4473_c0_g1_i1.p1  ORF type:complete len:158 (+),score=31.69 TRINITY_DN4473_c0_g1_i1:190-663(+)